MYEYTGKEVQACYFNRIVFNTYLTDKERRIIDLFDYYRYDTMENGKTDYPHISWITTAEMATDFENTNLDARLYLMIMDCREHTYELYANDTKDNPERILQDLQETLREITPKMFYDDCVMIYYKHTMKWNIRKMEKRLTERDETVFMPEIEGICRPMLMAIELNGDTALRGKAKAIIERKHKAYTDYARKKAGIV